MQDQPVTGWLATTRGWRTRDHAERSALDQMCAFGPQTGGASVYVAFPWSALIDASAASTPDLKAAVLQVTLRALCAQIAPGTAALTVCQHPALRDHAALLVEAGITEVFWTHATPADLDGAALPGLKVRPFPALPDPSSPIDVVGEGPGSVFAFCPPETGGNTPYLWAAVMAGLVPVIPLARAALPGPPALWLQAAVFHDGLPAKQETLKNRLAMIAKDAGQLAAMGDALRQLTLLYGPGRSTQSVALRMIDLENAAAAPGPDDDRGILGRMMRLMTQAGRLSGDEAAQVLRAAAGDMLLNGADGTCREVPDAWLAINAARARLHAAAAPRVHFEAVLAHARALPRRLHAPRLTSCVGPAICLLGPRGQRTPLSYGPLRRLAGTRLREVADPGAADLILTGWNRDLEDNRDLLRDTLAARPATRIAVISEEPLWDSLWSGGFAARDRSLKAGDVEIPYRFLNHANCGIFDFRRIPYFLLTNDAFTARYSALIAGFAGLTPRDLLAHWRGAPLHCAVFAERRTTPEYMARFPEQEVYGLSVYRSRIAELIPNTAGQGAILRVGQGWPDTLVWRQALADWHLDKLARLHGRVRICAAHENTWMRDYITEKPFDAFAVGAVPAVVAGAGHRLRDLIAPDAMLDTAGCAPDLAAARIAAHTLDLVTAEAWLETAARLVSLFRDTDALIAERRRVVEATLAEIAALV